jgi:ribonuclease HII
MQSTFLDSLEQKRLLDMSFHETRLRSMGFQAIAGIDEAGRGPLAGPVVAAACILAPQTLIAHINDSKKLGEKQREALFETLTNDPTIAYGIGIISSERIDEINILQATFEAMQEAVRNLTKLPDYLLIDGNQLPRFAIPSEALVKGDSLSVSIAAASIIAKTTRDRLMLEAAKIWPQYGFEKHKGYGTARHVEALRGQGPCPIHRRSFEPVRNCH